MVYPVETRSSETRIECPHDKYRILNSSIIEKLGKYGVLQKGRLTANLFVKQAAFQEETAKKRIYRVSMDNVKLVEYGLPRIKGNPNSGLKVEGYEIQGVGDEQTLLELDPLSMPRSPYDASYDTVEKNRKGIPIDEAERLMRDFVIVRPVENPNTFEDLRKEWSGK